MCRLRWPSRRFSFGGQLTPWWWRSWEPAFSSCLTAKEIKAKSFKGFYLKWSLCFWYINFLIVLSNSRVPGEIKRSRDLRGGRWSWTLNFAQKRSWIGRWSWAEQVGRLLLQVVQVVRQQQCNGHCHSDSVQHSSWNSNCAVHKSLGNGEGTPP